MGQNATLFSATPTHDASDIYSTLGKQYMGACTTNGMSIDFSMLDVELRYSTLYSETQGIGINAEILEATQ